MYTYQDLEKLGDNEKKRIDFIQSAISEHKASDIYKIAFDAEEYDRQNNITIMSYQKVLYNLKGQAVKDMYSPNHKICSNFFNRFTTQENQYLLGNGVTMDPDQKEKLGPDFDQQLQTMGRNALVEGESFGFWNYDHLECFRMTEFVPLYDENTSALRAGIRFFQIDSDKPLRATLYEMDGYTDYLQNDNHAMEAMDVKRPYIQTETRTEADGTEIIAGKNYEGFPIIPMWGNPHHQSELVGLRQSIDAYDLIKSGFANDMDGAHIYWLLKNSGGMDDIDLAKFMERLNILGVAAAEDETEISPHEINIPYESRVAYLDRLEQDMYRDYQALNVADISGSQKTATEIAAAYQPFDNKADMFEYCVLDFLSGLFEIAGVEGEPTFTRTKVINQSDDIQAVLLGAQYLDDEYITKKICNILGDPDAAQEIMDRRAGTDINRLIGGEPDGEE